MLARRLDALCDRPGYPRRRQLAALFAFLGVLACAEGSDDAPGAQSSGSAEDAPRIVLLISVDTLRPDRLGSYGYTRETSPRIDALASRGVLFEQVMSVSPWTLPAHASMLTGLTPTRHGVTSHDQSLSQSVPTLASRFREAGFVTAAAVNSSNLGPEFGLSRDFEHFLYVRESAARRWPSTLVTDRALMWVDSLAGEPLFLFLHYYDVHSDYSSLEEFETLFTSPYDGPWDGATAPLAALRLGRGEVVLDERDVEHLLDLYDAGIRQMDSELGRLFDALAARDLLGETLVVLTSDHGEEFLEHGSTLHGRTQYQEVVAIPLIFAGPGVPAGGRVGVPVSLVDVVPTLLALTGLDADPWLDGTNLVPLWEGETTRYADRVIFSESDHRRRWHDELRAARRGNFKLIYNRRTKQHALYELKSDPGEMRDVAASYPTVVAELRAELDAHMAAPRAGVATRAAELSADERAHLQSLGYLE